MFLFGRAERYEGLISDVGSDWVGRARSQEAGPGSGVTLTVANSWRSVDSVGRLALAL